MKAISEEYARLNEIVLNSIYYYYEGFKRNSDVSLSKWKWLTCRTFL